MKKNKMILSLLLTVMLFITIVGPSSRGSNEFKGNVSFICDDKADNNPITTSCIGITVESYVGNGWVEHGFTGLTAWRIYAEFTSPSDGMISVWGSPDHPMSMASSDGAFYNDPMYDSLQAPCDYTQSSNGYWANQWDTYVTMDAVDCQMDPTTVSPGFGEQTNNLASNFSTMNAAWYTTSPGGVILAGYDLRITLGQFVVAEGESIIGSLNLWYLNSSSGTIVELLDQYLESPGLCPSDVNGDGIVDVLDLLAVLAAWGACPGCPEDVNGDGVVNVEDLLMVLANWS